jgi:hypothetical protein
MAMKSLIMRCHDQNTLHQQAADIHEGSEHVINVPEELFGMADSTATIYFSMTGILLLPLCKKTCR